ncbi:myotubularin-related protein 12 isoform X2 [Callorhinchus milii]|uniref:myotubularin-related protein 12 isoform X2 n=1 Tax=Callorhinchus milii TaxID=7868 RepID=UPI0004574726|nr:myotubularin-related protein 12 isoform X2 [Callorhinchus milii]|eukprot:gi/632958970/ref/XP_007895352.1/ PREDICTED: myotubularin-related protein 12 isoform X2 [Callorhinchus milii]
MLSLGSGSGKTAKPSFVSYVSPEEIKVKEKEEELMPQLLPGELIICEANTVMKYPREDALLQRGFYGKLVCTNFKISFQSTEQLLDDLEQPFRNKLMGENDISLHCVDQLFGVYDEKKKPLLPGAIKNKIPEKLLVYCKDFRVFYFGLRQAKEEDAKRLIQAIVHYCLNLMTLKCLFAFSYVGKAGGLKVGPVDVDEGPPTVMFETKSDWKMELDRTEGVLTYRVVTVNENYKTSSSLPQFFVVPSTVTDEEIKSKGNGIPLWCWSHCSGCALLKMAALPEVTDHEVASQANKDFIDRALLALSNSHHVSHRVRPENLSATLPSLQEIQASYNRFKQLFLMDNGTEFWESDHKCLSALENANWLEIIRQCLKKALDVVEYLEHKNTSVVLVEEDGSDLCCLIASLVQVMVDPYFRTISGFQSLIQKEWVMGCHRFLDRCNHLRSNDKYEVPVFLLFLECVWQLHQQHTPAFEFTETYLTILSDSLYIPIFSTFLFNSPQQRDKNMFGEDRHIQSRSLKLPTVWEWSVQFEPSVQALFYNPLFIGKPKVDHVRKTQRVKPQRQMSLPSSPSYQSKPVAKKSFLREETDNLIKTFLGKKISRWTFATEDTAIDYRPFYEHWRSKPIDYQGLLLPLYDSPVIRIWVQRYMRWIPEAQIPGGGPTATLNKACEVQDEIKSLKMKLEATLLQRQPSSPRAASCSFRLSSRLSSVFPFGTIRRQSVKPRIPVSTNNSLSFGSMENLPDDEVESLGVCV